MAEKLENYVLFKREVASDFRDKKITRDEMVVYFWMRLNANPYGISTASLSDIDDDLFFGRKSTNYINKILLSLKKQRRIFYQRRTGSRGSFKVHFADFIVPHTKQITKLDKLFLSENIRTLHPVQETSKSELDQSFDSESQNSKSLLDDINSLQNVFSLDSKVRTLNNDKNKDKDIDKNRSKFVYCKTPIYVDSFTPKSDEEVEVLEIAKEVGEMKMNFILSILHRYGIEVIRLAFVNFKEDVNEKIEDLPSFFNSKVQLVLGEVHTVKQSNNSGYGF